MIQSVTLKCMLVKSWKAVVTRLELNQFDEIQLLPFKQELF